MRVLFALALLLLISCSARADSPLTSTEIWKVYQDLPSVKEAHDIGRLNTTLANFLISSNNSIDKKAAVINALSWNVEGKQNALLFREVLGQKYQLPPAQINARMNADETFCLAYLVALDDYFHVVKALTLAEKARADNPKSFTVAIICALIECQAMSEERKSLWPVVAAVLDDKHLTQDMRKPARAIIADYMLLYK